MQNHEEAGSVITSKDMRSRLFHLLAWKVEKKISIKIKTYSVAGQWFVWNTIQLMWGTLRLVGTRNKTEKDEEENA